MTANITYDIYTEKELIIARVAGTFKVDDILSFVIRLRKDSRYDPTFKGVGDFRGGEADVTLGLEEVQWLSDRLTTLPGEPVSMWVLLVGAPRLTALATLYEQFDEKLHYAKVFSTVAVASDWLGKNLSTYLPESH